MSATTPGPAARPTPGAPRPYEFPAFARTTLANGLNVITVDLPGRPLVSAVLVIATGAVDEPATQGGVTVLAARSLSEGTERYDALALTEASERLGASLHAEAGWDSFSIGVDVPSSRLEPALELLAELAMRPTFPESEVDRLRDERLNDILQAHADPRRRSEEVFIGTIYSHDSPYHRPAAGQRPSVAPLTREDVASAYRRAIDPSQMTLVVGGELAGLDVPAIARGLLGGWTAAPDVRRPAPIVAKPARRGRIVRLYHRPGAVQTEIRIGHVGLPRLIPDFHALSVMTTILGGLFASRLNMKIREEKGYAYGAGASFDLRRAAGPFSARTSVQTAATVPATLDVLAELSRMRDERVTDDELRAARDYLVGVFPLRFETPAPVVGSIAGLVVQGLPDDELARYRPAIEAVTADDVLTAARDHLDVDGAAVVLVGDADAVETELRGALGEVEVIRDDEPLMEGTGEDLNEEIGPVGAGG